MVLGRYKILETRSHRFTQVYRSHVIATVFFTTNIQSDIVTEIGRHVDEKTYFALIQTTHFSPERMLNDKGAD